MSENKKKKDEASPLLDYAENVGTEDGEEKKIPKTAIKDLIARIKGKLKKKEKKNVQDEIVSENESSENSADVAASVDITAENSITEEKTAEKKKKAFGGEIKVNAFVLFIGAAIIVIVSVLATFWLSAKFYDSKYHINKSTRVTFSNKDTNPSSIAKYQEIIDFIEENYYTDFDINELIEGSIEGMVEKLEDKYSTYYGPNKMDNYTSFIEGTYSGIGITVSDSENGKVVTAVTAKSSADKAGVKVGDVLTSVNGKKISEYEDAEFSALFKKDGETLKLEFILADGTTAVREIKIETVKETTVFTKDLDGGLKYIRISQFIPGTADEFKAAVDKLGKDCKGIVLDMRNNPGGYENEASKVADMLLPEGVIATAKNRKGEVVKTVKSGASEIDMPIVVLINQNTASAAELVTGAFRDFEKGEIVGVKSYGKALGQRNKVFSADGSGIVLSTSRYYTPSGECIDGVGITPTKVVELEGVYAAMAPDQIPEGKDLQLYAAMEVLGVKVETATDEAEDTAKE